MNENFKERLKSTRCEQDELKRHNVEGYRAFLSETTPGFIAFLEILNRTITELEKKGIIGKVSLRTRIKSLNSSLGKTEVTALEDVFGFKIVAENERDKEILMLIIHKLFLEKTVRHKNYNKSNGYFAHHCTGAVKYDLDRIDVSGLAEHIINEETNELKPEYRDIPKKEQQNLPKEKIYCKKTRYPTLKQEMLENEGLTSRLQEILDLSLSIIKEYLHGNPNLIKDMPVLEMQFITKAVQHEAKYGKAKHMYYKKPDEKMIIQSYLEKKLVRGVHFPFVFIRNDNGDIELEHTSQTLISMWPFLEETIEEYRQKNSSSVANYDMFFAKVFPALEPYVNRNLSKEPSLSTSGYSSEIVWSILKSKIMNDSFVLPDSDRFVGQLVLN